MDGKVVRRERLHERSSAVDGRERERKGEWRRFGYADGCAWVRQWVEDGRPGRQHDIRAVLTSRERETRLVAGWGKAMTFGGAQGESQRANKSR